MLTLEQAKKSMEIEIGRAKKLVEFGAGLPSTWIDVTIPVLGKEEHTVKVFVLEGAPPKGYVIADYTLGIVKAFRKGDMRNIKTFKVYKRGERLGIEETKI